MHKYFFLLLLMLMPWSIGHASTLPGTAPLTTTFTEDLIIEAMQKIGLDDQVDILVDTPKLPMGNQETTSTEILIEDLRFDQATGRFSGMLVGTVGMTPRFHLPLEGRVSPLIDIAVLVRPIARGEQITASDLDWVALAPAKLPKSAVFDPDHIIGSEARRRLTPGRVLTNNDIRPQRLVRRGEPVRLVYADGELRLTALGTARDDGAFGELVRVLNPESRLEIQGIATGPAEVTVGDGVTSGVGH